MVGESVETAFWGTPEACPFRVEINSESFFEPVLVPAEVLVLGTAPRVNPPAPPAPEVSPTVTGGGLTFGSPAAAVIL